MIDICKITQLTTLLSELLLLKSSVDFILDVLLVFMWYPSNGIITPYLCDGLHFLPLHTQDAEISGGLQIGGKNCNCYLFSLTEDIILFVFLMPHSFCLEKGL